MKNIKVSGYLAPGFHDCTVADINEGLVAPFTDSTTRKKIFDGYVTLVELLKGVQITAEQWLDGSFCTDKVDPGDLDMVSLIDKDTLDNLSPQMQQSIEPIFLGKNTKQQYCCDSYLLVTLPPTHPDYNKYIAMRKYWLGQFGFDRNDVPKGILRINA